MGSRWPAVEKYKSDDRGIKTGNRWICFATWDENSLSCIHFTVLWTANISRNYSNSIIIVGSILT